jgi:hypothetical protein
MAKTSPEALDSYLETETALIEALNNYVDVRIEKSLKTVFSHIEDILSNPLTKPNE